MQDPIMNIEWRHVDDLNPNSYNPNVVFNAELKTLEANIVRHGWIQPILITTTGRIIDGFHRYMLSKESKALHTKYGGLVPCAVLDLDEGEAVALTIRMNRAKGAHVAVRMAGCVKILIDDHGWSIDRVMSEIGAARKEVEVLYQDSIFKAKGIEKYKYSKAWEPADEVRQH